jgi:hypothetical protein
VSVDRSCARVGIALILLAWVGVVSAAAAEPASSDGSPGAASPWWASCVGLRDDRARLACFDAKAPPAPNADAPGAAQPASAPQTQQQTTQQTKQTPPPAAASRLGVRLAGGYGLGIADYAGRLHAFNHGYFDFSSGIGSAGDTYFGQAWLDGALGPNWTLGVEYLQFRDTSAATLTLPHGVSVLTDGIEGHADAVLFARMLLLNVAWRPETIGPLRPSLGVGLGPGRAKAAASLGLESPFFGLVGATPQSSFPFGAVQAFAGLEYVIVDDLYVAFEPRVLWMTGHPLGKDQRYLDFVMSTSVGVNF